MKDRFKKVKFKNIMKEDEFFLTVGMTLKTKTRTQLQTFQIYRT